MGNVIGATITIEKTAIATVQKVSAFRDQLVADINRPEGRWGMHGHSCVDDSYFDALEYVVAQLNDALAESEKIKESPDAAH